MDEDSAFLKPRTRNPKQGTLILAHETHEKGEGEV
jgi:hypothetical protein